MEVYFCSFSVSRLAEGKWLAATFPSGPLYSLWLGHQSPIDRRITAP